MNISSPIVMIIGTLIVGIVILSLVPAILTDFNAVFNFSEDSNRNPIFGSGLGSLVPLILGFVPIVLILGLLAIGYVKWRGSQGG
ncbi:MAG: hypothetical protein J4F46_10480 [Dehalococcoidia bacterium]|nr:hypothetical protein [Dehalococcoidia bacterium]